MKVGAASFFTDYSMGAADLAQAASGAEFEVGLGARALAYPDVASFALSGRRRSAEAILRRDGPVRDRWRRRPRGSTKTIKLGTGVCLVIQRDTIQSAKSVASLGQVSGGRFLFGIGGGWNAEEMEDRSTEVQNPFQKDARADQGDERDLDQGRCRIPGYGDLVDFRPDGGVAQTGAEAAPAGHRRRRLSAFGAPGAALRRRLDPQCEPAALCRRHRLSAAVQSRWRQGNGARSTPSAGDDHQGATEDYDRLRRYEDQGIARLVVSLPPEKAEQTLPALDRWAELIRRIGG